MRSSIQKPVRSEAREVIVAEGLGKRYVLGGGGLHSMLSAKRNGSRDYWALKDVSFSVNAGESLGIVGANGAGKSTLLKLLSRITVPTTGRAAIRGRVGTILEIGTGFHPELSGRENIFLSGAILGLKHSEIEARFDEIVAFSDLHQFIDTPVKRYSSGMYVRLAFAVVAHLEPDILIVDEVLAVGDVAFQKKCLTRMEDGIQREGRTILFVSHNFEAIRQLCRRAILLEKGGLVADGSVNEILGSYASGQQVVFDLRNQAVANRTNRTAGRVRISDIALVNPKPMHAWSFQTGERLSLRLAYKVFEPVKSVAFNIAFTNAFNGQVITTIAGELESDAVDTGAGGEWIVEVPALPFRAGEIAMIVTLGNSDFSVVEDVLDSNVNLPRLSISAEQGDLTPSVGYVDVPFTMRKLGAIVV